MNRLILFTISLLFSATALMADGDHGTNTYPSPYTTGQHIQPLSLQVSADQYVGDVFTSTQPLIVVRYLGYSCSHCVEQLTYLNRNAEALKRLGVRVIAFSNDDPKRNAQLMERMGYDADVISIMSDPNGDAARQIGAIRMVDNNELDLHAALVIHNHKIMFGVYGDEPYMDVERLVATAVKAKGADGFTQARGDHALDKYLSEAYTVTTIYGPADGINGPVDLEFNKSPLHPNDIWAVTTSNPGYGIAIIHDATTDYRSLKLKKDSRASHFMWRTMALSMGPDGSFATAQNGENGDFDPFYQFMGPTLWSSDTAIFAQRNQSSRRLLGSHLDMLHQSPMNLGIAHEKDNVYWVSDGFYNDITRFDFADPHEFGGHDHRDGIIRKYPEAVVERGERGRPAHMAFDAEKKWLYYVDPANNRVMRLDITSGAEEKPLTPPNASRENLAEFTEWSGATVEVVVDEGLGEPVGIHIEGDRLLIGDRISGDIHMFDLSVWPVEKLGFLVTGAQELLGITVGPDQRVWFADRGASTIGRLQSTADHSLTSVIDVAATNMMH